jgi:hypothetical protein
LFVLLTVCAGAGCDPMTINVHNFEIRTESLQILKTDPDDGSTAIDLDQQILIYFGTPVLRDSLQRQGNFKLFSEETQLQLDAVEYWREPGSPSDPTLRDEPAVEDGDEDRPATEQPEEDRTEQAPPVREPRYDVLVIKPRGLLPSALHCLELSNQIEDIHGSRLPWNERICFLTK